MKFHGLVPPAGLKEGISGSQHFRAEAGPVMDSLASRMSDLEQHILAANRQQQDHHSRRPLQNPTSPSRHDLGGGDASARHVAKLEERVYDLSSQVRDCEAELQHTRASLKEFLRSQRSSGKEAEYSRRQVPDHETMWDGREELRSLNKRIKKLAENTSKACRSLATGLSDVQQATLNLYSWSDKAHEALGTVSVKLNYPVNICPRAKVYSAPKETELYNF